MTKRLFSTILTVLGFVCHGLSFKQLICSYSTQYEKDANFSASTLMWHLKSCIDTYACIGSKHPPTLAITARE
jgi:hypothetical protein